MVILCLNKIKIIMVFTDNYYVVESSKWQLNKIFYLTKIPIFVFLLFQSGLIDYYLDQGFPASKLLFGVPTYGRTYLLEDVEKHGVHASAVSRGDGGPILHKKGVYSYGEVS